MRRTGWILAAAVLVAAGLASGPASAQEKYPSKPIKILVPYAPGGATDYAARLLSEKAKIPLGASIVIENKPGAGGIISLEELAHAKPDGYTLMIGNVTTNCITPVLFAKKLTFDFDKDIVPVARLLVTPNVFLANAAFPAKTFKEFIDYTKKNPGKVRYASSGIGSFPHFDTALLAKRAGLDMIHIPYKGGAGEMVKGIVNGEVNVTLLSTPITIPQVKAGTVRVLSNVTTRLEGFKEYPTFAELGYPDVGTGNWSALFAPNGTPKEIIDMLYKAFTDAVKDPEVKAAAAKTGTDIFPAESIEATQAWLKTEMAKWRKTVQEVPVELN
ncbi:MAG TPA: tripartite tricarboxylate transporter substrate binding protein [Xanthobacteraceae bacterium]|nr:tripartite tricarboxylate transporter substrate binding protein [Xanthobacteraceae bacterium]